MDARTATDYFLAAAADVRENKQRYERAALAAQARPRMPRNPFFYAMPPEEE